MKADQTPAASILHAVTGAFGYSGSYIARSLLGEGHEVITLTNHPPRSPGEDPFGGRVQAYPYHFNDLTALSASLRGVDTLYNTYWVRFNHARVTYATAVENTLALFRAAQAAGVRRIVHISITNPELNSPLPYFQGKARLEQALQASGISYAILRPTVIFGREDILINNIAYLLRRAPLFGFPGDGSYRLQPVFAGDLAELAVQAGRAQENLVWDAAGPEIFTFAGLVGLIARNTGSRARLVSVPPGLALFLSRLVGLWVGDVVLTQDELSGLMANLLVSASPPRGCTFFSDWLAENSSRLGQGYASELKRHYRV